ncbi:MAG: hydantoinase/oxoprolinase family protein [Betaproteobacteria bacterium]
MQPRYRVAADIGGTFTDIAVFAGQSLLATWKLPSTPDDYARAVADGICAVMEHIRAPLSEIGEVLHGCTVATNAILEHRGARTALITTRGFRDVLEFRRIRVPRLYDPLYVKPEPLAPRELRFEVTERMAADGSVVLPLEDHEFPEIVEQLRRKNVEALAVAFLHSYANPVHERRAGEILRKALPDVHLTLSSDILPEIREYERTSTAVINAYVGPPVAGYVASLERQLKSRGIDAPLLVMQSSGGVLDAATVKEVPARIVECGPAAGVIGAARQSERSGHADVITLDMGGTTAKTSMIEKGAIARTDEYEVGGGISLSSRLVKGGGYALKLPVIDISEVGAGGGSIVWFDKGGALKLGPRSAGAAPGPACYGAGGTEATVTDANVVLGFVNPTALAGGTVPVKKDLAEQAVKEKVANPLKAASEEAAWSVFVVACANMMRAVKAVSTYRGRDPRDCALMAFGGNGGIFAFELARQLQMKTVLVPPVAGVFSAYGLGVAEVGYSQTLGFARKLAAASAREVEATVRQLKQSVLRHLGYPESQVTFTVQAAMRYVGQAFELRVPLGELRATAERFEKEHEATYGHRMEQGSPVEFVALEVVGTVRDERAKSAALPQRSREDKPPQKRKCYFGPHAGFVEAQVVGREALRQEKRGPLVVEEYEGTTVVPPGASARLDAHGNIVIVV